VKISKTFQMAKGKEKMAKVPCRELEGMDPSEASELDYGGRAMRVECLGAGREDVHSAASGS
jgi:hypothetical protein